MTAKKHVWTLAEIKAELDRVARIGEVFVEGDLCRRAWQPHAETFMDGDDMDYNPETTVPLKKTLLRLERVCPFPCAVALWRRRPDFPDSGEALLYGSHGSLYDTGKPATRGRYRPPAMTPEMKTVFLEGRSVWTVRANGKDLATLRSRGLFVPASDVKTDRSIQRFVPVKDSLGDVAAMLEVFTVAIGQ